MSNKKVDNLSEVHDNNINVHTREIFLYGEEGYTGPKLFSNFLKNLKILESIDSKPIVIHQFNYGGDCASGFGIYDAIIASRCKFVFVCYGAASSMGSILPQAVCSKGVRITTENCEWLIHEGYSTIEGTYKQTVSGIENSKKIRKKMYNIYTGVCHTYGPFFASKTKSAVAKYINNKMSTKEDWIFDGTMAVEYGFADAVLGEDKSIKEWVKDVS